MSHQENESDNAWMPPRTEKTEIEKILDADIANADIREKELIKEVRKLFTEYYDYVYTTDSGEQRGELKDDFAREAIKLIKRWK